MPDHKIYSTGQIINLEWTDCNKQHRCIIAFRDENQASKFKAELARKIKSLGFSTALKDSITKLDYEASLSHEDLAVMGAANDKLPLFFKAALTENTEQIYLKATY